MWQQKWLARLGIGLLGRNRDEFLFRIAQGGQLAAKDATSINVNSAVQPLRLRNGRMSIDHHCRPAILCSPIVANGQAKFVGLARRFAEQGELAHCA